MNAPTPAPPDLDGSGGTTIPRDRDAAPAPEPHRDAAAPVRHPALRLVALAALVAAVAVHNLLLRGALDPVAIGLLAAGLGAYGLVTWVTAPPRPRPGGRSPVLVVADLAAMAAAVYVAGADQSWLFWVFVLRVLDPDLAPGRALGVAALGTGAYLAVLAWVGLVDGGTVAWGVEAAKLAFLALGGTYAALVTGAATRERDRLATQAGRAGRSAGARHSARRRELERAEAEARARSLAKSRFLARVSHEVRSPVSTIVELAQELEQASLSEEETEGARRITERGQHLLDVLNEVLDLARVEMGSLDVGPVPLEPALRDVLVRARRGAERRRIRLPRQPPPGSDVWVTANDRKLRQVFANLISNAIKYNSSPGEIRLACDATQGVVRVSVTDTGPGIAPDRVAAAFRPFDRLGAETTGVRGTGLGLTVARSLAEAMGGRLGVDTHPGAGSTFWFELDRAEPAPDPAPTPAEERGPTVLYIGSQAENLMLVRRILDRRRGVELLTAPTGLEGIDAARAGGPAVVLLERTLPDMAGSEALTQLREELSSAAAPVVVVTAEKAPEETERLLAEGAHACFNLPYEVVGFRDTVDALLRIRGG